ncbi:MAG: site-specific DNA-methyltransferase, partial [Chloroflexi bacterium]|nr:site-specific DNA-methyltransferase [Chloroflexota bacterium]
MAKRKGNETQPGDQVADYRHKNSTRVNIPPAGLAARGQIVKEKQIRYAYNPHLTPALRFDATGKTDRIAQLVEAAGQRRLEPDELKLLEEALHNHEPWLEWAGKREQQWCVADPVALHIHERISTQAILRVARRQNVQRSLFADPEQEYREAVQFYRHRMDWTNRMILGDSLSVMASLARREALAGKVQMIYMDPPYGIKYASNFQPEVGRRDVKDRDDDLTRQPEMVKAYRDTWTLGVHSYLSYLRDRLLLCRELLADTGSTFVQISDENLHRVRALLDEVFGAANQIVTVVVKKKGNQKGGTLDPINDYLLWYAKDRSHVKIKPLFVTKLTEGSVPDDFDRLEFPNGELRPPAEDDLEHLDELLRSGVQPVYSDQLTSGGEFRTQLYSVDFEGEVFRPAPNNSWKHNEHDMCRVVRAERVIKGKKQIRFRKKLSDFGCIGLTNVWADVAGAKDKVYVVQTNLRVVERCLELTTDPGDLVLDPTCGSGTTAYVAEEWGRRWITIDVSRVALAIARQRLLTAKYDYYRLRPTSAEDVQRNPDGPWLTDPAGQIQGSCTFDCKTVPHIMLKSIAQNQALDPIFEKWAPVLAGKLAGMNAALKETVSKELRFKLLAKLEDKRKREGKKAVTDADERRWKLPEKEWREWEVPFDSDPDWPRALQNALTDYRQAWRQKMDKVNACIAARADQEELVDQPFV